MNSNISGDFPIEKFFPIKGNQDLLLRLTIGVHSNCFWVESDLVSSNGNKIIHHFGLKQNLGSFFDAVQSGLSFYHSSGVEASRK